MRQKKHMSWIIKLGFLFFIINSFTSSFEEIKDYPIHPAPFTDVKIADEFWAPRIETNRKTTIPFAFRKIAETGRLDNFYKASGQEQGKFEGKRYNDTDVYKVMEGAAYSLAWYPDPELEKYLDRLIEVIAAAQEEDGYLYTARTVDPDHPAPGAGASRWINLQGSHELYNSGHLFEAAVAHYQATGKHSFLNIAIKNADLLTRVFGPGKKHDIPGHQEIEIGLAKLYRVTGNTKYIELAKFFLDQRGKPHESEPYPDSSIFAIYNNSRYMQDHLPVLEQEEAVGHAVRAVYMYAGMADIASLTGNIDYVNAIDKIWENVISKKIYLTGGVGSRHTWEAFGDNYELPNRSAYNETCAAIGNTFWNHRLFLLHGDAKYIDVMEKIIYNGLISGVSLSGDLFFYQNPLESNGGYERSPWFEVSCCPGNIARFLPSFSGYIYAIRDKNIYVNLYVKSRANIKIANNQILIIQETQYPWEGRVKFIINPSYQKKFSILFRIPGWAQNQPIPSNLYQFLEKSDESYTLKVNRKPIKILMEKGFARIERKWQKGDIIELNLPMPVRRVIANEAVEENRGKVALERGPLVYCAEGIDNNGSVLNLVLPDSVKFKKQFKKDLLNGIMVLKGKAIGLYHSKDGKSIEEQQQNFLAVPYYAWAHRDAGEMIVWIPRRE